MLFMQRIIANFSHVSLETEYNTVRVIIYLISSFKRHGVYLILGLLGAALISKIKMKETGAAFISEIKIEENEIMCQFKTNKIFLKPFSVKL